VSDTPVQIHIPVAQLLTTLLITALIYLAVFLIGYRLARLAFAKKSQSRWLSVALSTIVVVVLYALFNSLILKFALVLKYS